MNEPCPVNTNIEARNSDVADYLKVCIGFERAPSTMLSVSRVIYLWRNVGLVDIVDYQLAFEICYLNHLRLSLLRSWSLILLRQQNHTASYWTMWNGPPWER